MTEPEPRTCKGCGIELDDYCLECQENALSQSIQKVHKARVRIEKRFRIVPIEEEKGAS